MHLREDGDRAIRAEVVFIPPDTDQPFEGVEEHQILEPVGARSSAKPLRSFNAVPYLDFGRLCIHDNGPSRAGGCGHLELE